MYITGDIEQKLRRIFPVSLQLPRVRTYYGRCADKGLTEGMTLARFPVKIS